MIGIAAGIIIILAVGFFIMKPKDTFPQNNKNISGNLNSENEELKSLWEDKGVALSGRYGDAEIVNFEDKYRIYYSEEPESSEFSGKIYSAISTDGLTWAQEQGIRKEWATFVSIIKLDDGKYRMYFQNEGKIKSALSSDGLTWTDESGIRIDTSNSAGLNLENVASPTIIKINGKYIMVYRGDISGKYSNEVPNNNIQLFLWTTSDDGLNFEKKGIAIDSRNSVFNGLLDGPEFVNFEGETRLYFWTYSGVYHVTFNNNIFSEAEFDFSLNTDSNKKFPPDPPCDPTIIKINNKWFMYYGQHTKGIYYAVLE